MVFQVGRKYWMSEQFKHLPNMPQKKIIFLLTPVYWFYFAYAQLIDQKGENKKRNYFGATINYLLLQVQTYFSTA